ncbi:MAG: VWA domain-containing protein, partial [Lachnospiraceae bacterium]|nr:VWA domain-containing protein [Lachnospiraceae bacterium]
MKKRMLALILSFCMITSAMCGCGNNDNNPGGGNDPVSGKPTAGPVASDKEIESRIRKVGKAYDGLYEYDDYSNGYKGMVMYEAVCEEEAVGMAVPAGDYATGDSVSGSPRGVSADPDVYPYDDVDWNTENYNAVKESGFVSVATQPFSTFGADVDTATYSNFRRSVYENDGYGITADAIRIEEMINYFSYDYPTPAAGEKFGTVMNLAPCPWNSDTLLLRVGIKAEEIIPEKGSNIVFLIDTSGSMFDNNKLPLAQEAFKLLQEQLSDKDTISIVTYAGGDKVVLEGAKGSDHEEIVEAIDSLEAWGSTNGEGGIKKAYEIAEKYFIEGGNNRILLATDGDLNVGVSSEAGLIELVEEKKESGVFLSCLGFGSGNYQDDKMEALADHGNGNYSYIDCSREAERVLKDEINSTLFTVAKDVKFQVEFNPDQVKGYRLIGYENRKMAAEDFADDSKDGGEVGSGQCVTVLYEIVTTDSAYEIPEVESRYGSDDAASNGSDELLTVSIRYKEPDEDTSKLLTYPIGKDSIAAEMDDDTSWAAGIAQFGMLIRGSEFAGTSDYQSIRDRLKKDPRIMSDDFRA